MIEQCILYLDEIVEYVNPSKLIYVAIDGVAPMAKMKQQRYRRYKSVSDRFLFNKIKQKHNIEIPKSWNNSSITPGTIFMDKIRKKLIEYCNNVSLKRKIKIIFSSSNTPGEGEHKLFDFIKANFYKNYMVYGLDADLIFLSIASKRKNILLLREANQFDKKLTGFNIIQMDVFKHLILEIFTMEYEAQLKDKYNIKYINPERLLNDFVVLYFLLGNDFIPHVPSLHIYHKGSDLLIKHYVEIQIRKKDYLLFEDTKNINEIMLFSLFKTLAKDEEKHLNEIRVCDKKKFIPKHITDPYKREMFKIENLMFQISDPIQIGKTEYNKRYYEHYMLHDKKNVVDEYIKNISWIHQYYFKGVPSWTCYYPYHVAPFLSDIIAHFSKQYDQL